MNDILENLTENLLPMNPKINDKQQINIVIKIKITKFSTFVKF